MGLGVFLRLGTPRVECSVCAGRFRRFLKYGVVSRRYALCPKCGALERHRWLSLVLRERGPFEGRARILHISPAECLEKMLRSNDVFYVAAQLEPPADVCMDLERASFPDNSMDAVVCSHVLEHVFDDRAALREIRRILKHEAPAFVMVPFDRGLDTTFEDPTIKDPRERVRAFGQKDHVRRYGRDYVDRISSVGFAVEVLKAPPDPKQGLQPSDEVLICRRVG